VTHEQINEMKHVRGSFEMVRQRKIYSTTKVLNVRNKHMGEAIKNKREAYKNYYRKGQKKIKNINQEETLPNVQEAYRESWDKFIGKREDDTNGNKN
jgi:hypothetical protein